MNHGIRSTDYIRQSTLRFARFRSILEAYREPLFVWLIFAIGCAALFYYQRNATEVLPSGDEWWVLGWLIGEKPVTWGWLWSQHNEHRIFLPRVVLLALSWCSNCNESVTTSYSAVLGCISAFLIIQTLRTIRGRMSYLDVVPALALLHWGNSNYMSSFQLCLVLPVFLFVVLVSAIIAWQEKAKKVSIITAGTAMVGLPLCGGGGLPIACLFGLYFVYCSWKAYFCERKRLFALLLALFPAATYSIVVFYFVDYHHPIHHTPSPDLWASFLGGLGVLSNAFGMFAPICIYLGLFLLIVSLVVSGKLVSKAIADRDHRDRCIVLLLAGASIVALAFCIGNSRIGLSYPAIYLGERYITLISPLFFILWAAFATVSRTNAKPFLQVLVAFVVLITMGVNYQAGYGQMRIIRDRNARVLVDVHVMNERTGEFFASKYDWIPQAGYVVAGIDGLAARRLGVFSPEAAARFRESHLPYLDKRIRLNALQSKMNKSGGFAEVIQQFNHDGVAGWSRLVCPPSQAILEIPPKTATIEVEFGIYQSGYAFSSKPDVVFRMRCVDPNGRVEEIWSRRLDPGNVVGDRRTQRASIAVPSVEPGTRLFVETASEKGGIPGGAYWSDFQLLDGNGNLLDIPGEPLKEYSNTVLNSVHLGEDGSYVYQIEKLEKSQDGLEVTVNGYDPFVCLPVFETTGADEYAMTIDVTSPCPTTLQVFYATKSATSYCEENSVRKEIHKGRNVVRLCFPAAELTGHLRLDPGNHPGRYVLHDIELNGVRR